MSKTGTGLSAGSAPKTEACEARQPTDRRPVFEALPARHERPSPACGGGWEGATPGPSSHMPVNAVFVTMDVGTPNYLGIRNNAQSTKVGRDPHSQPFSTFYTPLRLRRRPNFSKFDKNQFLLI